MGAHSWWQGKYLLFVVFVVLCCVLSMLLTQLSLFVCFNHNDGNDNDGNNNDGNNDDGNNNDTATTMMVTTMMATTTMGTTANGMTAMTTTTTTKRQRRQMERRRMQRRLHGDDNNVDDCGNNSRQQRCTNPCHHKNQTTKRDKLIFSISFLAPAHMRHLLWGDHEHTTMYSMARRTISLDRSARAVVNEDDLAALVLRGNDRSRVGDDRFNPEIEGQI